MAEVDERPNVSVGDREVALANEIIRSEVGSGVHGMAIEGTDDRDEMGVYIERPEQVLGLEPSSRHFVSRTKPEGERSGPGDLDLTLYSLRKYLGLAMAGNPTVLLLLFAPETALVTQTPLGEELQALAPSVVSKHAGWRFLRYLEAQQARMEGHGPHQSRKPKRPELVEAHGFDTKYASHALRLGFQGIEMVTTGRLTLPMPFPHLHSCREVKMGLVSEKETRARIEMVRSTLTQRLTDDDCPLPENPDWAAVNRWMVHAHLTHWSSTRHE